MPVCLHEDASSWIDRADGGTADGLRRFANTTFGKTIGVDLALRDVVVKPGDDFDEYANGGWRKTTEIPADRSSTGVGFEVFQKAEKRNPPESSQFQPVRRPTDHFVTPARAIPATDRPVCNARQPDPGD